MSSFNFLDNNKKYEDLLDTKEDLNKASTESQIFDKNYNYITSSLEN